MFHPKGLFLGALHIKIGFEFTFVPLLASFCVLTVNNLKLTPQIEKEIHGMDLNPVGGRRGMSLRRGWGVVER